MSEYLILNHVEGYELVCMETLFFYFDNTKGNLQKIHNQWIPESLSLVFQIGSKYKM